MSEPAEPTTIYTLMFDPPEQGLTIRQVEQAMDTLSDQSLYEALGLISILGPTFEQAFGPNDTRSLAIRGSMGPIGAVLERRGHNPMATLRALEAFDGWRASMALGGPDVDAIPSYRLSVMRSTVQDALAQLGPGAPPDFSVRLGQVVATVDAVLQQRELGGPAGTFQA